MKLRFLICLQSVKLCVLAIFLSTSAITLAAENTVQTPLTKSAWLREVLPNDTLLYARIPSLWNTFSYKSDNFKQALGSSQNVAIVTELQSASQSWLKQADPRFVPLFNSLAGQLNGPIEIAALAAGPMPSLLVTLPFSFSESKQVMELLQSLQALGVVKEELQALKDDVGLLKTDLGPLPYRWDPKHQRLNFLVSFGGSNVKALDAAFAQLKTNASSPMLANEKQMDSSAQGLYVWFNNQQSKALYQGFLPSGINQQLTQTGITDIKAAALSWAVHNGKGRIKLQLDAPQKGSLQKLLPQFDNRLKIATVGEPSVALLLSSPSNQQLKAVELGLAELGADMSVYQSIKKQFEQRSGVSVEQVLAAIGPELVVLSDMSGEYLALKVRSPKAFKALIDKMTQSTSLLKESQLVDGREIVHLKLAGLFRPEDETLLQGMPYFVRDVLSNLSSHLYWQKEGNFIIVAELSQTLQDRQQLLTNHYINLQEWLLQEQKQDLSASVVGLSGSISQAPKRLYYGYISFLQMLADITGAKIDTTKLPSATELRLADKGTLGLQLDANAQKIGLELVFESTPADALLLIKGAATAALTGASMAILKPALQDAKFKDMVTQAENAGAKAKLKMLAFHIDHKRFPNAGEAKTLAQSFTQSADFKVSLSADKGVITITFADVGYQLRNDSLMYSPSVSDGSLEWRCTSDVWRKYRPKQCAYK